MKIILFQLLHNLSIGSPVFFEDKELKIVDVHLFFPWTKSDLRPAGKKFISFLVECETKYGDMEIFGANAITSLNDSQKTRLNRYL